MLTDPVVAARAFVAGAWPVSGLARTVAPSSTNAAVVSATDASASTRLIWIAPTATPVVWAVENAVDEALTVALLEVGETLARLPMNACVRWVTDEDGDSPLPEIPPMLVTLSVAVDVRSDVALMVSVPL